MKQKSKKILNIGIRVLVLLLIIFALFMMIMTVFTVVTVDKNDRSIFGMKLYIVQSDSMSKSENNAEMDIHFKSGDIVLIENLSEEEKTELEPGEVIAFFSTNSESYGETVTHMIREARTDSKGRLIGYVSFGTNTGVNDESLVAPEDIYGRYVGKLSGVGNFFSFLKSTKGYFLCVLIPFLALIIYNSVSFFIYFKRYEKEKNLAFEAELLAERKKTEKALCELQELKKQISRTKCRQIVDRRKNGEKSDI